jgi:hypothetical protein
MPAKGGTQKVKQKLRRRIRGAETFRQLTFRLHDILSTATVFQNLPSYLRNHRRLIKIIFVECVMKRLVVQNKMTLLLKDFDFTD